MPFRFPSARFWGWNVSGPAVALLVFVSVAEVFGGLMRIAGAGVPASVWSYVTTSVMVAACLPWLTQEVARQHALRRHALRRTALRRHAGRPVVRMVAVASCAVFALCVVAYAGAVDGWFDTAGLVAPAALAELKFRFAVPLVVGVVVRRFGFHRRDALVAGLLAGAVLELVTAGTTARIHDLGGYAALVALFGYTVWRSHSMLAPVLAHCVYVLTVANPAPAMGAPAAMVVMAVMLVLVGFVAITPAEVVIDLRDARQDVLQPNGEVAREARPAIDIEIHAPAKAPERSPKYPDLV